MNLVLVDRVVFHPILGGLVVAGVICVRCYFRFATIGGELS
jgi:hypothetical protein